MKGLKFVIQLGVSSIVDEIHVATTCYVCVEALQIKLILSDNYKELCCFCFYIT